MRLYYFIIICFFIHFTQALTKTIEVCPICEIRNVQEAANEALPGDTILIRAGIYTERNYISNLQGAPDKWITITAASGEEVIFRGQTTSIQFSDPAYLEISNLIFEGQTANGLNIDDGGSYDTPAKFIRISNCEWRYINATGNNDMLKMSGVDNFWIYNCSFKSGSPGGSGIDMVGCHNGVIEKCKFENQGSNSIQTKGGSRNITIQKNLFINGGLRSLNIGGSTGLEYFRPQNADYEAAEIFVYSNIFVGSQAPIAFVGAVNCEVINNTIYLPTKWAIRILQETTLDRFQKCGQNAFINNIVYVSNSSANPVVNIGPNTEPETFIFSNNLWFNKDNPNWAGPNLPVSETNSLVNINPLLTEDAEIGVTIDKSSPAQAKGLTVEHPLEDYLGNLFNNPRSIGALEVEPLVSNYDFTISEDPISVVINPISGVIEILKYFSNRGNNFRSIQIFNAFGECIETVSLSNEFSTQRVFIGYLPVGVYFLKIGNLIKKFIVLK
jgi:hypothetical protein